MEDVKSAPPSLSQVRACKRPRMKGRFVKGLDPNEPGSLEAGEEDDEDEGVGEASGAADADIEASEDDGDEVSLPCVIPCPYPAGIPCSFRDQDSSAVACRYSDSACEFMS